MSKYSEGQSAMDLKYLNTFKVVVEEGSFIKAAGRLSYTQSTITFQIGQLEEELSTKLFEKIGRRMVLTQAGKQLLPYVDEVLASVNRMRDFEGELAQCRGDLHVAVGETLLCYHMPPILKRFRQKAPNARLFLRSMNCYDIRDELLNGALDLGVFYADAGGFGSSLTSYTMGNYPLSLVASPDTKQHFSDFRTPDRAVPLPLVINEPNCIFRQIFEKYLKEKAIRLDHTIELWSIPTIKKLVANDVGVSFLPRFAVEDELASGVLAEIQTDLGHLNITAVCAHHKNKWISPLMQLFIDLCASSIL